MNSREGPKGSDIEIAGAVCETERMKSLPLWCLAATALSSLALQSPAQEWTRFRGPNGPGVSHAKTIPTELTPADINWKIELPGVGHSSPVLWGDRVFLTCSGEKEGGLSVLCYAVADGKLLWKHDFPLRPFAHHKFNSFASATPAVTKSAVYVVWNEPEHYFLTALDHEGKQLWQRDFGPFVSQHACGVSPIVVEDKVILGGEQDGQEFVAGSDRSGQSFVAAVNAETGATIWQTPRKSVVVAYSTPIVRESKDGRPALIFNSQGHGIYMVDAYSGKVLWEYAGAFDKRSVSSPFMAGDLIFGSCGSGGGGNRLVAVKAGDATGTGKAELAYEVKKSAAYVPTGLAVGDLVWIWSDGGIVTCLHAPTGEIRFQERVGGNFFGSPIWVDGRLFAVSTSGEVDVVEASDKFKLLHRFPLGELCHSTPAVAGGRLYIRTEKHLLSLGGKAPAHP
jgi:outer membrane protein assembly factor BamB